LNIEKVNKSPPHLFAGFDIDPFYYAILTTGMPDHPASSQSGTGLEKTNDARTSPVPE
jgi:hypothetical protein